MNADKAEMQARLYALEGYLSVLEPGKPVTKEYIKRLNDYYLPLVKMALHNRAVININQSNVASPEEK